MIFGPSYVMLKAARQELGVGIDRVVDAHDELLLSAYWTVELVEANREVLERHQHEARLTILCWLVVGCSRGRVGLQQRRWRRDAVGDADDARRWGNGHIGNGALT